MKEGSEQEKKDKKFSMIMSAIVHGTLLAIFLVLVAWREPDPPIEEYGMEINLGFQAEGFGDNENDIDNPQDTDNDTPPESEVETEEVTEETQETTETETQPETEPEVQEQPQEQPVEETQPTEPEKAVEDPVKTATDPVVTQETESPVKVEEEKKEEVKKEEEKPVEEKKQEQTPPVEEKKEEEKPKPKPTVDNRALLGSKKSDTNSTDPASSNQGKVLDERGNMGKPDGKPNTDGQVPGGADFGVSLSLDGWKWDRPPAEKDDSQIDGIIKFQIKVDDRGDVLDVIKLPGTTISDNTVVNFYEKQVRKLIFIRTDKTKAAANISKGEITFVIKTK